MIRTAHFIVTIRNFNPAACALVLCLSLALVPLSSAQTNPTQAPEAVPKTAPEVKRALPTYEGQTVTSVELAGRPDLNTDQWQSLLTQRQGQPFSQARIDESIAALKRVGQFADVRLQILPEADGVRVLLVLEPALYFGIYEFPGSGRFSYSRLLQVADFPPRGPYSSHEVDHAKAALETYFKRNGYFLAQVSPEVKADHSNGLVNVTFAIRLGRRAGFGEVNIEGVPPDQAAQLKNSLRSFRSRLRGSSVRAGKTYKVKTLQNAAQYMEKSLSGKGHLAASAQLAGAKYDPETNRANVTFNVNPGPVIHVKVQGAHLWSWTRRRLLPIYQQVGVGPEVIQEGKQNLISYFQSKGYFDANVRTEVQQHPSDETILYQITKGPRHKVAEVSIAGNKHISGDKLLPHITVKKGSFISHGKYSQQLVRKTISNLTNIYQASGFSEASITPEVQNRNGNIAVTFRIKEGPQDVVEELRLEGNQTASVQLLAPKGLKVVAGQPYSQSAVNADKNQIVARYLELGYLTATFRETIETVDNNPHRVRVIYHIEEGPQVQISSVITLGNRQTQQKLIDRYLVGLNRGTPLKQDSMLLTETNLYQQDIFDWAQVDPRRRITTQNKDDVVVRVHEGKRNALTYGGGFEVINRGGSIPSGTVAVPGLPPVGLPSNFKTSEKTFWGPRGTLEFTRKNLFGKAESFNASAIAGRLDQRGTFVYTDPNFRWTNWSSNLSIAGEHNSENPIFTYREGEVNLQFQHPLNKDKTTNVFVRYGFSETGLTRLLIPDLVPVEDQHVRLSTLSASYIRDTRDNALDAHKGIYESFELDFNPSALGSNFNYAKLLAQTAYYKKIPASIIWANSIRIGMEKPFSGHVPVSERFFSGGGSTLRGFPLNGAGPQHQIPACGDPADPSTCALITVPVGGNELLIVNSEFRIPLNAIKKNLGLAAFYDGGNVLPTIGFHGQYTNSFGIGLRYSTPVGPVRIDVGHNLNAPPGIKSTQFFVTLGQAF